MLGLDDLIFISVIVTAEKFLESVESNQNYPVLLLTLIDKNEIDMTIRVAGAIAFKNYVKRNWGAHLVSIINDHSEFDDCNSFYSLTG